MKGFDVSAIVNDETLSVWVPFNSEVSVKINFVSKERYAALLKSATTTTWDRDHQPVKSLDQDKFGEALGLEAIADWSGMDANQAPLPCTPGNIKIFMRKWLDFAKFISDTCTDLERLVAAEQENLKKNSETTSEPEPIIPA